MGVPHWDLLEHRFSGQNKTGKSILFCEKILAILCGCKFLTIVASGLLCSCFSLILVMHNVYIGGNMFPMHLSP